MSKQKVIVVGAGGMVGSASAYAMALQGVAEEIVSDQPHHWEA